MPSSRYYKFKTENQKERMKRFKILFFVFSSSVVILAAVWLIFISLLFKITNVEILENGYSDGASSILGSNLLILSKSRLKSELSTVFPDVTNIEITKKLFHTIKIDFQKRAQIGVWCHPMGGQPQADHCFYFDKEGVIFKEAPQTEGGLIFKVIDISKDKAALGDKVLDNNKISFIIAFSRKINENNKFKILEFKIKPKPSIDLEAVTDRNWSIYLDENQEPATTANNLITILEEVVKKTENLEYVDLRIPGRIFYK